MADSDNTEEKQSGLIPFRPGQSGNPTGRPKGSRNKFGEAFVSDFLADWQLNGAKAIEDLRKESVRDYVKVAASIVPRELNVRVGELDDLTDDQLIRQLTAARQELARAGVDLDKGANTADSPQPSGGVSTLQ